MLCLGKMALDYAMDLKLRDTTALLISHGAEMRATAPTTSSTCCVADLCSVWFLVFLYVFP